jgi:hypothetical protein
MPRLPNPSCASLILLAALLPAGAAHAQSSAAAAPPRPTPSAQDTPGADAVFARWDIDKNKSLSAQEFRTGWEEMQFSMILRKLHANFVTMDTDKSGALEPSEYANLELVRKAGRNAPTMAYYDTDKNGHLDFKEYSLMVTAIMKKN